MSDLSDHSNTWQLYIVVEGGGRGGGDGDYDCRLTVVTLELYRGG